MSLREQMHQLEQVPVMRADPLPTPVNPWQHLADELGDQDIAEGDPLWPQVVETFRLYERLREGSSFVTANRIVLYTLAQAVTNVEGLAALHAELGRCLGVLRPGGPRKTVREAVRAATAAKVEEKAGKPPE